jgi:hypothetical protein
MYIAKLKKGPKRVVKLSQMILKNVFKMVWWRGRKWVHTKRILKLQYFSPLKILTSPFYLKRLLKLFFFFLFLSFPFSYFFSLFSMLCLFDDSGILMMFEEKDSLQNFFQMEWDDMANPWLWRWGSYGYISSRHIFQSGVIYTNILKWG